MRIALGLEYDGTGFCGWQTQPDGCGVQDILEEALGEIAGHSVKTVCAGRTDAGVHACCQVAHFDVDSQRPLSAWTRGVNGLITSSASVLWAQEVDPQFHARFSATARRYRYFLLNRPNRPGLFGNHLGWFHAPLDESIMHSAAQTLVGEHDFSAFRAAECQAKSPVRVVHELSVSRLGDLICFNIRANAFLHHMVRNIVGSLVYVGYGRQSAKWLNEILEARDRTRAAPTFAANGLYLHSVEYDRQWGLPQISSDSLPVGVLAALA
ncbi:MAG: tRNA pseudouridine(38-40) synthase TruA [Burkholderiales bacterium]|jgi:tRNA pseudouridine38-40 synthase